MNVANALLVFLRMLHNLNLTPMGCVTKTALETTQICNDPLPDNLLSLYTLTAIKLFCAISLHCRDELLFVQFRYISVTNYMV